MINKRPALIARCADAADVERVVTFARERELLLAVRGGGHSFPGYSTCDGGLMIDLSSINSVPGWPQSNGPRRRWGLGGSRRRCDAERRTRHYSWTDFEHGRGWSDARRRIRLAVTAVRLACDNLVSAQLVTADGKLRRVSEKDEPDLFWAIRGGGGNFGVATSFEYRLHPLNPRVLAGHIDYPAPQVKDAIEFYAELISNAPRELSVDLDLSAGADGQPSANIYVFYAGDPRGATNCWTFAAVWQAGQEHHRSKHLSRRTSPI